MKRHRKQKPSPVELYYSPTPAVDPRNDVPALPVASLHTVFYRLALDQPNMIPGSWMRWQSFCQCGSQQEAAHLCQRLQEQDTIFEYEVDPSSVKRRLYGTGKFKAEARVFLPQPRRPERRSSSIK